MKPRDQRIYIGLVRSMSRCRHKDGYMAYGSSRQDGQICGRRNPVSGVGRLPRKTPAGSSLRSLLRSGVRARKMNQKPTNAPSASEAVCKCIYIHIIYIYISKCIYEDF